MKLIQVFDINILPRECIAFLDDISWEYGIPYYKWYPNMIPPVEIDNYVKINQALYKDGMVIDELPETYVLLDRCI